MVTCITGAGSGIGKALAVALAKEGYSLVLSFSTEQSKEEFFYQYPSLKTIVCCHVGDLSDDAIQKEFIACISKYDVQQLFFCAGRGVYGDACDIDIEKIDSLLNINVMATTTLLLQSIRVMKEQERRATILLVSSSCGEVVVPGMAVYGASKAYQTSLARSLDAEYRKYGIRVLVACPGLVETPFVSKACSADVACLKEPHLSPEEVANVLWDMVMKRESKKIFPLFTKIGVWAARIAPHTASRQIYANIQRRLQNYHGKE